MTEHHQEVVEDEIDEDLDPRVKHELETLNFATDEINARETELTELRDSFKTSLNNATQQLEKLAKKYGKNVSKSRPYYEALKEANQAKTALARATKNFQRATGIHRAAKETISLAEERLHEFEDKQVNIAWQEMLNVQTIRFMEAEKDKFRSERLHETALKRFEYLDDKSKRILKKKKNSSRVAKPYYELKDLLEVKLQKQRQQVEEVQKFAEDAKKNYRNALSNLEMISAEIHEKRKQQGLANEKLSAALNSSKHDSVDALAKESDLDIIGPKSYDDIEELEIELEEFSLHDDVNYRAEEDNIESDEDTPLKNGGLQRSMSSPASMKVMTKKIQRQTSLQQSSDEKPARRRLKVEIETTISEESEDDDVTDSNSEVTINKSMSMDTTTYGGLHGISVDVDNKETKTKRQSTTSNEFDIFDELC